MKFFTNIALDWAKIYLNVAKANSFFFQTPAGLQFSNAL